MKFFQKINLITAIFLISLSITNFSYASETIEEILQDAITLKAKIENAKINGSTGGYDKNDFTKQINAIEARFKAIAPNTQTSVTGSITKVSIQGNPIILEKGKTYNIYWKYSSSDPSRVGYDIRLENVSGKSLAIITSDKISEDSFSWTVPRNISDMDRVFIVVRVYDNTGHKTQYQARSSFLSIKPVASVDSVINIISPNGGPNYTDQEFGLTDDMQISWTSSLAVKGSLALIGSTGSIIKIAQVDFKVGNNSYVWKIPNSIPVGRYGIRAQSENGNKDDSDQPFTIVYSTAAPVVRSMNPAIPSVGDMVTLNGVGFGKDLSSGELSIAGIEIKPISINFNKIVFIVPRALGIYGEQQLRLNYFNLDNGKELDTYIKLMTRSIPTPSYTATPSQTTQVITPPPPQIVPPPATVSTAPTLYPTSASVGMIMTLRGTGFSSTIANNEISVGGFGATITSATPTSITFIIPNTLAKYAGQNVNVDYQNWDSGYTLRLSFYLKSATQSSVSQSPSAYAPTTRTANTLNSFGDFLDSLFSR